MSAQASVQVDRDATIPTYSELEQRSDAPPGSSWGVFGAGDDMGTLNFLTPAVVAEAARCVRRGLVFNLDRPLDAFPEGPVHGRGAPAHSIFHFGVADGRHGPVERSNNYDDRLDGFYPQSSSHIDALRHVINGDHGFYEGVEYEQIVAGTPRLGIGCWAERGVVGRGVLIDVAGLREAEGRPLDHLAAEPFGPELLERALGAQGVELRRGDMLIVHTGVEQHFRRHPDDQHALCNAGLESTRAMVGWLWDRQISLVASDNIAVEPSSWSQQPSDFGAGRNLHSQLIPLLGYVLGELWKLDELVADSRATGVWESLLVLSPLNLVGGVGSPANATAIR